MNIDMLWQGLIALAVFLTGMSAHPTDQDLHHRPQHGHMRPASPSPRMSPGPSTPPGPSGSPTATPSAAPEAKAGELAPEEVCPGQSDPANTVSALTCLTTHARVVHGLPATAANDRLMAAATAKDQDMLNCGYGHTACGHDASYWVTNKGYTGHCSGENIAEGQKSPREVFAAWMSSPGHRANILNKNYRDLGVAEVGGSKGPLWVMELGGC